MKIFDAAAIRQADAVTIQKQGITSLELMERAAGEAHLWLRYKFVDKETVFHVFCGRGNNGGDGLVIARMLREDGYRVYVNIVGQGAPSPDFEAQLAKIKEQGELTGSTEISSFGKGKAVVIDALFGTGFTRDLDEEFKAVIATINNSGAFVVSIDVPSGMFLDRETKIAVKSDVVLTFQFPKLAFYLPGNYEFVKEVEILDIGLDKDYIENTHSGCYLTNKQAALEKYRRVHTFAHKGMQGHTLIIGGSYGRIGAVTLSAKAALKSGCGLVTAYLPECGYNIIQTAFPEGMAITNGQHSIEDISFDIKPDAIGIGPGLGLESQTQQALHGFLQKAPLPLVLDADALNILSANKEWLGLLPKDTILTPHPKELERLIGPWKDDFDKVEKLKIFAAKHNIIVVAKDAHTLIVHEGNVYVNSTGNAALATAGSGDVLTGIIAGLLAQGYTPADAAIFGAYLHGLTADVAVADTGLQAFTASDILAYMGRAYLTIEQE